MKKTGQQSKNPVAQPKVEHPAQGQQPLASSVDGAKAFDALNVDQDSFFPAEITEEQLKQIGTIPALAEQVEKLNQSVIALQKVQEVFVAKFDLSGLEEATKVKFQAILAGLIELQTKLSIEKVKSNIDIAEVAAKTQEAEKAYLALKDDLLKRVAALEAVKGVAQEVGAESKSGVSEAVLVQQLDAVKKELEAKINEQKDRINRRVAHQELSIEGLDATVSLKEMLDNISALQKALKELQSSDLEVRQLAKQNAEDILSFKEQLDHKADRAKVSKALGDLKGLVQELEEKVNAVSASVADTKALEELRARVDGLDQVFANKEKVLHALKSLQDLIAGLEQRVQGIAAPVAAENKGLDELAAKVAALENALKTVASVAALETLNQELGALKSAPVQDIAAAIDPKLAALELNLQGAIKAIAEKVAALDGSLPTLKSVVAPTDLDAISARVNDITNVIWDSEKGLISHINSHRNRLAELEGNIAELERNSNTVILAKSGDFIRALQESVEAQRKIDIESAKKKDAKVDEANHYTNLLRELLGLVVKDKAKTKTLVAHLFATKVLPEDSHDAFNYMLYRSLQNLDPNLFGFAASDLTKSDGKSLDELDLKALETGLWKDANASNSFFRTHSVKTKAEKGQESKTVMKSGVDSPFNVNRNTDATRFAIVREILKQLLTVSNAVEQADIAILNRPENSLGLNAAHIHALAGNVDALKSVIESNPDLLNSEDKFGNTVLHYAAANFNGMNLDGENYTRLAKFTAFDYLVDKGADQSQKNSKGLLPIEVALSSGNIAYIKSFMMKNKAATVYGHEKVQHADDKYLLDRAVELGNVAAVSTIRKALPSGASNLRNAAGQTAMHIAAQKGDVKVLDALIAGSSNKASLQSRDSAGNRPVDLAVISNNTDAIRWFATHGQYPKEDTKNQVANVILSTVRIAQQRDFGSDVKRMAQDEEWLKNSYKILKDKEKEPVAESAKTMRQKIEFAFRFYIKSGFSPSAIFNLTYDPRIDTISRPHHMDIYNHLVSNMESIASGLKDKANANLKTARKNPDVYYAFVPSHYETLDGEEREDAREAAMADANSLYLRELMIAYHLYARKIEAKIGESKTHSEGTFAHILGDLIVALHHKIQDARHAPRLDAVKLLLICQNSTIEDLQNHPLFTGLPARDAALISVDNINAEKGLVDKQFGWMLDPNAKVAAEVKKSRRELKKEKEDAKEEKGDKEAKSEEDKKSKKDDKDVKGEAKKKAPAKAKEDEKDSKKKDPKSAKAKANSDSEKKKVESVASEEELESPKKESKKTELKSEGSKVAEEAKAAEEAKKAKTKTVLKEEEEDKEENSVASKKSTPRDEEEEEKKVNTSTSKAAALTFDL